MNTILQEIPSHPLSGLSDGEVYRRRTIQFHKPLGMDNVEELLKNISSKLGCPLDIRVSHSKRTFYEGGISRPCLGKGIDFDGDFIPTDKYLRGDKRPEGINTRRISFRRERACDIHKPDLVLGFSFELDQAYQGGPGVVLFWDDARKTATDYLIKLGNY